MSHPSHGQLGSERIERKIASLGRSSNFTLQTCVYIGRCDSFEEHFLTIYYTIIQILPLQLSTCVTVNHCLTSSFSFLIYKWIILGFSKKSTYNILLSITKSKHMVVKWVITCVWMCVWLLDLMQSTIKYILISEFYRYDIWDWGGVYPAEVNFWKVTQQGK